MCSLRPPMIGAGAWWVVSLSRIPLGCGGGPHGRRAAVTLCWPASGAGKDDELLGGSGHRDVAVDRSFDARAKRIWVDEDDQVELEPLGQLRGQRPDAGRRLERGVAGKAQL